jgi:ribosomal protein S18 acetylase RimI-like enzyme
MPQPTERQRDRFTVREARAHDLPQVHALMLRILDEDYGYGFKPELHADVADLQGYYLANPRHTLIVAVDGDTEEIIAAVAVRAAGVPDNRRPRWLLDRYDGVTSAEICRLSFAPEPRRRGAGRAVVEAARRWIAREGGYRVIQLHTNARPENAGPFWFAMPTTVIWDGRGQEGYAPMVHFEMEMPSVEQSSPATHEGANA